MSTTSAECQTYVKWINSHLKIVNQRINNLETDFLDGSKLKALVEVLSGHKFSLMKRSSSIGSSNLSPIHKLNDIDMVLQYLKETENIKLINIDSMDIANGELNLIMALIWALICHYSLGKLPSDMIHLKTPKQRLMSWLNSKLYERPVRNLTSDWNDGRAIGALVNSYHTGLCPDWKSWTENDAPRNIEEALKTAETILGVQQIITPLQMTNPKVEEKAMITYLSMFIDAQIDPEYLLKKNKLSFSYLRKKKYSKVPEKSSDKLNEENNKNIIAIDFGTSFSSVGILIDDQAKIIANKEGQEKIPSYVSFTQSGKCLVGNEAKNQLKTDPENTIYNIARIIGKGFNDKTLQEDMKTYPFKIIDKNNKPFIELKTEDQIKHFAPEEIAAMILRKLKETAEDYLGSPVTNSVITVPALFNNAQRESIINSGLIAGLTSTRIINEQTASSISYAFETTSDKKNILMLDFGGGSLSCSLFKFNDDGIKVLATCGDSHLGGENFDTNILNYYIDQYKEKYGKDITKDKIATQNLRLAIENAKKDLSCKESTTIHIDSLIDGKGFHEELTRSKFEEINQDLFVSTMKPIEIVLQDAKMNVQDVDDIVLVGGTSNIPKIKKLLREMFGKEPTNLLNSDKAATFGSCLEDRIIVNEVCNLSLGIEVKHTDMSIIIPKNTPIPTKIKKYYTTYYDNQLTIRFPIFQGENKLTKDNYQLGQIILKIVNVSEKTVPEFEVTFEINADGILKVIGKELKTENQMETIIENYNSKLSIEDIDRMIKDSKMYANGN